MTHGGNIYEIERKYPVKRENLLDFSANINPLGVPESLKKTMIEAIDDLVNYPDINYFDLKKAIGGKYKLEVGDIYVGNGGVQVIFDFINAVKPKKSLVVYPTFIEYERGLKAVDCSIQEFFLKEETEFQLDVEKLIEEIDETLDMVILCNPNNPTGTMTEAEGLITLLNKCREKNVFLMVDEAFMDFADEEEEKTLIKKCQAYENLMITRSFTKFYGIPGLRLGFGVCSHWKIKDQLKRLTIPWTVNTFASCFGRVLQEELAYEKRTYQWLEEETKYLLDELNQLKLFKIYQPKANYILLKLLSEDINAEFLKEKLIAKHILIRNCSNFKGLDDHYLRIAIKDHISNEYFIKVLRELSL